LILLFWYFHLWLLYSIFFLDQICLLTFVNVFRIHVIHSTNYTYCCETNNNLMCRANWIKQSISGKVKKSPEQKNNKKYKEHKILFTQFGQSDLLWGRERLSVPLWSKSTCLQDILIELQELGSKPNFLIPESLLIAKRLNIKVFPKVMSQSSTHWIIAKSFLYKP
jgi:hypothetical protein